MMQEAAKRVQEIAEAILGEPQPISADLSAEVELNLTSLQRVALALLVMSVMSNDDKYMTENMRSWTYSCLLAGLRQVLPGLPDKVRRQDVRVMLSAKKFDPMTVGLPPPTIYHLSKAYFEGSSFAGSIEADLVALFEQIETHNSAIDTTLLPKTISQIGQLALEIYSVVGMRGDGI